LNDNSDDPESDTSHELTDVLNAHGGYWQDMKAAFPYNLKRRPFFRPYSLLVTRSLRYCENSFCCDSGSAKCELQGCRGSKSDLSDVLQFSRHASLATLQIYLDKEKNLQGKLSTSLARHLLSEYTRGLMLLGAPATIATKFCPNLE
jgi:hypothetical protein